jgi:hypothetical protein
MKSQVSVPIGQCMKDVRISVTVTGLRWFRFRLRLGAWILKVGAWVTGAHLEIGNGGRE